jgi:hypothetical protein
VFDLDCDGFVSADEIIIGTLKAYKDSLLVLNALTAKLGDDLSLKELGAEQVKDEEGELINHVLTEFICADVNKVRIVSVMH